MAVAYATAEIWQNRSSYVALLFYKWLWLLEDFLVSCINDKLNFSTQFSGNLMRWAHFYEMFSMINFFFLLMC